MFGMTDTVMGKPIKRKFEPTRMPVLKNYEENWRNLDPELRKLRYVLTSPTHDNREYAFWIDSVSQSFAIMTSALIAGNGIRVRCSDSRAKDVIQTFMENINIKRMSIEDYVTQTWIDELIYGNDYWRILINKDYETKVDIQRLDPKTITPWEDKHYGWTSYVQKVPNYKSYRSKASFYRNASLNDDINLTYTNRAKEIWIPDEPDVIMRNSFFWRPPMSAAIQYIVYKRYILYFMRKFSQRLWAPLILFMVGDPKTNYYPTDDLDMQRRIDDVATLMPDMTEFSMAALQGDIRVEEIGKNSARSSAVFVDYINMLDKQIMMSQFASMGLRDASGTELATSSTLKEMYLQFINGMRRRYKTSFENFFTKCLCKVNRININHNDLDLEFSPLKFEPTFEYMRGVNMAVQSGAFKDLNEVRKASQVIWGWLEDLDKKENKKIQFPVQNMIKQQKPSGTPPKPAAKSSANRIMEYIGTNKL